MHDRPPLIGLTLDSEEAGGYSKFPWYAIRQNYCEAVIRAGGLPVALPHEPESAEAYLDRLQGLIVTGGAFDVDPVLFGADARHESVVTKDKRTRFELAVTRGALARNIPVLGICGGQQLLNVALGGSLIQHIPDSIPNALAHEQPNPRNEAGHEVTIVHGTLLHRIVGSETIAVNSAHHQAVDFAAPECVVDALAPDGVVEGIESTRYRFCLGVQWHPEFAISMADTRIFAAFVQAARDG
ncbi:MAG: gamma-glutamyl-gamma-aminobutyrate hydrolase [Rhodospirillaceae bacterium]|nr:gamma-glutamyl-gamma-aminobutyrate hydrolase [Rhodospirillaceae bacterium]